DNLPGVEEAGNREEFERALVRCAVLAFDRPAPNRKSLFPFDDAESSFLPPEEGFPFGLAGLAGVDQFQAGVDRGEFGPREQSGFPGTLQRPRASDQFGALRLRSGFLLGSRILAI